MELPNNRDAFDRIQEKCLWLLIQMGLRDGDSLEKLPFRRRSLSGHAFGDPEVSEHEVCGVYAPADTRMPRNLNIRTGSFLSSMVHHVLGQLKNGNHSPLGESRGDYV